MVSLLDQEKGVATNYSRGPSSPNKGDSKNLKVGKVMLRENEYAVYPPSMESHIDINIGLSTGS